MINKRIAAGWCLGAALVLESALMMVLVHRLQNLSIEYQKLHLLSVLPHPGTVVPTFRTAALSGDSVTVGEAPDSNVGQLIFIFNTTCPYCKATIPVWKAMADSVARLERRVMVLAISLDSVSITRQYTRTHDLRYLVVTFPQRKLERLYRSPLCRDARLEFRWHGAL